MRNTRWLRYGLASIIVAGTGLGATLVACGDEGSGSSSSGNLPDANPGDSNVGDSNTTKDAADAAPKPIPAKLTFINALTDLGPAGDTAIDGRGDQAIRICFKQGTTQANLGVAPYPPLPDKPKGPVPFAGIVSGTGGTFPSFGLDLTDRIVVPIVMNVRTLNNSGIANPGNGQPGTTCDELVGDTKDAAVTYEEGKDYWILDPIPAGTLQHDKSYVLALTGCAGASTLAPGFECGPGFTPGGAVKNGNMKVQVFETTTTPVSATQLGVQVFHVSAQAQAIFGAVSYPLSPGFVINPDGGAGFRAATTAPIVLNTLTPAVGVTGVKDSDLFVADKASPGSTASLAPFPLPFIQALSGLGAPTAPTVYKDGKNYVFVAVGDPNPEIPTFSNPQTGAVGDGGDGTRFNTKKFHWLAFPTDPVIEAYKPGP